MISPVPSPVIAPKSAPPSTDVRLDSYCAERFQAQIAKKGVPMSKSSIGEWERCPARWAFRTIERQGVGAVSDELKLGRACHQVIANMVSSGPSAIPEDALALDLDRQGVPAYMLPSAVDWVLWAVDLVRLRGGRIAGVELPVRTGRIPGVALSGRFDLVLEGGMAGQIECLDWTFSRHPRFVQPEQMVYHLGTSIYRSLLAVALPQQLEHVVISDVHVPSRQVVSVELEREDVVRAWKEIQAIRDGMRAVARTGIVRARPGTQCTWCPFQRRCPHAELPTEVP
ncbi:MAG: RecB family exonuclease [Candidatus Dormibacteria bacterium]